MNRSAYCLKTLLRKIAEGKGSQVVREAQASGGEIIRLSLDRLEEDGFIRVVRCQTGGTAVITKIGSSFLGDFALKRKFITEDVG